MITMDENVNLMKLTYMFSIISLKLRAPFCTSTYLNVQTKEKRYLYSMYIMYANASNNTPCYPCIKLAFKYILTNHLSIIDKGCALVGTKT